MNRQIYSLRKRGPERCHFDQICDVVSATGICGRSVHYITSQPAYTLQQTYKYRQQTSTHTHTRTHARTPKNLHTNLHKLYNLRKCHHDHFRLNRTQGVRATGLWFVCYLFITVCLTTILGAFRVCYLPNMHGQRIKNNKKQQRHSGKWRYKRHDFSIVVVHLPQLRRTLDPIPFGDVEDGIYALGKAHMRSTPSLRRFPNVAFETVKTNFSFLSFLQTASR